MFFRRSATKEKTQEDSHPSDPSLLDGTLGHQSFRTNTYVGATSFPSRLLLELIPDDPLSAYQPAISGSEIRCVGKHGHFVITSDKHDVVDAQQSLLDQIEDAISPHGPHLVELYFRVVHPSYPVLHKDVLLEKYSRSYRKLTPACLTAVYMVAMGWWSFSVELAHAPKPDVGALNGLVPALMAFDKRTKLVAAAEEVGLHRDCSAWQIPAWERGVRRRVAWAVFVQDKWGALVHGRPSHIQVKNWDVLPLQQSDFPEALDDDDDEQGSSEVERGVLIFIYMTTLSQILSDIIEELFTVEASNRNHSTAELLSIVKPIQLRLKEWYSLLPPCLDLSATRSKKLSATGQLYLAYLTVEVTLHRAILESEAQQPLNAELRQITREAAIMRFKSVIEFLKLLQPQHMQAFWHFASEPSLAIITTFSLVLLATSRASAESAEIYSLIVEYRWLLNINGPGAAFTKTAVDILQANAAFLSSFRSGGAQISGRNATSDPHNRRTDGPARPELTPERIQETIGLAPFNPELGGATRSDSPSLSGLAFTPSDLWF
ncbi:Transcriptional activator protein DAL81 [Cyphellophora attinorum]|uniref:Transcriptional activator protein DAL81 n=1 Tax=Cyphellophora attinorum TaxID=1664694 RepID=A0A0N0NI24_9EURO|nr:Transcriptional activator protein DAL81 [Phialophora attinorum]KPI35351.1 Transcriptional activator protein DAL81 [Phialophora attinorum]